MNILGFREDCQASAWWRCWNWLDEFDRHGHKTQYLGMKYPSWQMDIDTSRLELMCASSDVVITSAKFFSPWIPEALIAMHKKYGFSLVVDNDDPVYMLAENMRPWAMRIMEDADLVVLASDLMVAQCEVTPRRSIMIPNLANVSFFRDVNIVNRDDGAKTRIVFAGGVGHVDDYDMLRPVIERIMLERDDCEFLCVNAYPDWAIQIGIAVPQNVDYPNHIRFMKKQRPAIALVPLKTVYRTELTTHTKYIDYTLCGIPGIYQGDHVAYSMVTHGVNGMKADSEDGWYSSITTLLDNPSLAADIVTNAKNDVVANLTTAEYYDRYIDAINKEASNHRAA